MTEVWKDVPGYDGAYQVSDQGRVRSTPRIDNRGRKREGRILSLLSDGRGYLLVNLCRNGDQRTLRVHRLGLEAFVGPCPEGYEACHNNGMRDDNRLTNLRWDTLKGNQADRQAHGTDSRGSKSVRAKLTESNVAEIFVLHGQGWTLIEIGTHFGVSNTTIRSVLFGQSYQ